MTNYQFCHELIIMSGNKYIKQSVILIWSKIALRD